MVPRPTPHPWLGKKTATRQEKLKKKKHVFIKKKCKDHIKWSQNDPKMVPKWSQNNPPTISHPWLGKTQLPRGKQQSKTKHLLE